MSYLWAELEERLLCRTAFAFGGLSLFFFFLFDTFCFSSEELWVGQGGQKCTLSVPLKCKKCYCHCKTKGWWSPINTIFKKSIGATGVRLTTKSQSLSHKTFLTEWTVPGQEQSSNAHTIAYEAGQDMMDTVRFKNAYLSSSSSSSDVSLKHKFFSQSLWKNDMRHTIIIQWWNTVSFSSFLISSCLVEEMGRDSLNC